ncbi:MAG: 16S rRNA (guanine(527)-N(7))-methyltransferase RsmG [Gammaproteobacteria bacterium]|jgi:16S rRNA (guanine527-N7)-methyltransferase|nr:16S rRNA (guanine(527)-N(7))-methyltransferase RsmG [Gammaproteobacteria bacterium]
MSLSQRKQGAGVPFSADARARLAALLVQGSETMGVPLDEATRSHLLDYLALLHRWNSTYNLTAVREPEQMVIRLLLDSLSIVPYIKGPATVLDIGTGAGLPGIPLALARPDLEVTLLDSNRKKTRFLVQAVGALCEAGADISVVTERVEHYRPPRSFDAVVSRAFSSLGELAEVAAPLCRRGGRLMAMKSRSAEAELAALPAGWRLLGMEPLSVPGLDAERCLVILERE